MRLENYKGYIITERRLCDAFHFMEQRQARHFVDNSRGDHIGHYKTIREARQAIDRDYDTNHKQGGLT